jgi:VanZ family protein
MVLMTILFFIGGPGYQSPRSLKSFWNLGHIIYFALLPLMLFSFITGKPLKLVFQLLIIFGITISLGVLVELFQYGVDRSPDMGDIFRNMLGACIAIAFLLPIRKSVPKATMLIFRSTLILLILAQFYPVVIDLIDEHHARRDFPVLSDFQTPYQVHRWTGDAAIEIENIGSRGNRAMRADLTTQVYSGVALKYFPTDWQAYQWFQFRIYNPSADAIKITCRIHDRSHIQGVQRYLDRFNTTRSIPHGWNTITISLEEVRRAPDNRQMDLSQIYGVGIFASRLPYPRNIYIDGVRLL